MNIPGWWFGTFVSHILGIIIPTDFHIFQRGWNHQPANLCIFQTAKIMIGIYIYMNYGHLHTLNITGWWFQTFLIFHNIWDNPSHWLIFVKMVKTTNQITYRYFHVFLGLLKPQPASRDIPIQGWAASRCDFSEALRCPCKPHVAWSHCLWCLGHLGRSRSWLGLVEGVTWERL